MFDRLTCILFLIFVPVLFSGCDQKNQSPGNIEKIKITVDFSSPDIVSNFEIGLTHTHNMWENGDQQAVDRVKKFIVEAGIRYQNQHIMGWGANNPEPSPGQYDWASLDHRIDLIRSMDNTIPVITFCTAPGWMKTSDKDWNMNDRVADDHIGDFANLCKEIVLRYPDINNFQIWNEFKGYWIGDHLDYTRFTVLYNAVYDAVKSVKPDVNIGGPYLPMGGKDLTPDMQEVIHYWLENKHGAEFFTFDGWLEGWPPGGHTEEWMMSRTDFFGRLVDKFENSMSLPIWISEYYGGRNDDPEFTAANFASTYYHSLRSGTRLALLWDGMGFGELFSDTKTSTGGEPTLHYNVVKAYNEYFGSGTQLYKVESSSNNIEVLASQEEIILINKRQDSVSIDLNGYGLSLRPYEVRLMNTSGLK